MKQIVTRIIKKITHNRLIAVLLNIAIISPALSADLELDGHLEQSITVQEATHSTKKITLLNIKLSKQASQRLIRRAAQTQQQPMTAALHSTATSRPAAVALGMHQVPVLDQGSYGTCVTFAVSAALDAALGLSDSISQLCSLQLGNHLSEYGYRLSGWDGSWGQWVLAQFHAFGFITKTQQKKHGCGGLTVYPRYGTPPQSAMTIEDYHRLSEPLNTRVTWSMLLDPEQVFSDKIDMEQVLTRVKTALNHGHRVTFAVLLPQVNSGVAGAVGWHHYFNDTWVVTPAMQADLEHQLSLPGHEMIITGYDDNAVAMDSSGKRHTGLLTLRNSWGYFAGDWGNFYMSYDYFTLLAIEAEEIIPLV